ncbi:hypothetical protein [Nostoc sp.]
MATLINAYNSDISLKTPSLKYTKNVVEQTDAVLISKREWAENNTTTTYCKYQYWKILNFSKGTKGIGKTFNFSYKVGVQKTTMIETAKNLGIKIGMEKLGDFFNAELSKKLQTSISITEEYTHTQESNISQTNNDWIWAIWQLVENYQISIVRDENFIDKIANRVVDTIDSNPAMVALSINNKKALGTVASAVIHQINELNNTFQKNEKKSNVISIVNFTQNTHEALDYDNY